MAAKENREEEGKTINPILKWQYGQIIKELLLLRDHQADPSCPCETDREMCTRKHLYAIEAYAEENAPIEEEQEQREKLERLAREAKSMQSAEEAALTGDEARFPADPLEWARNWRKEFEGHSLA